MQESYNAILVERKQSRLYVTLNRPEVRNAMSGELVTELTTVLKEIQADRTIRTLILRGAGGYFCAGGDIKAFKQIFQGAFSPEQVAAKNREAGNFFLLMNQLPQTVVMLVEGAAVGGGLGLACRSK